MNSYLGIFTHFKLLLCSNNSGVAVTWALCRKSASFSSSALVQFLPAQVREPHAGYTMHLKSYS